ncbi:MAG: hypothetical protein Q4G52_09515 [Clostridia bacterium]|nr:hypothetical protein [Clostridia bacterium]
MPKMIVTAFTGMMAIIVLIVAALFEQTQFAIKRQFLLPQGVLLLGGALCLFTLCALAKGAQAWGKRRALPRAGGRLTGAGVECAFWLALFVFQAFVTYHAYFLTDWDAGIMLESAYSIAFYPNPDYVNSYYYSQYPNNVLLTEVFAAILRVFGLFAVEPGIDRCALILCLVQCALNTCTGVLTRQIARRLTGSAAGSVAAAAVYVALVGCSPWSMIPYSDGMALIFPTAAAYLYIVQEERGHRLCCFAAIGALSAVALLIKPQACILTLAIFLLEAMRWLSAGKIRPLASVGAGLLAMLLGACFVSETVNRHSIIEIDAEKNFGVMHYVMLGLNTDTDGTYAEEDVAISIAAPDREARTKAQLETAAGRLARMGPAGLAEHLVRKTLVNYADGTFAWGINGYFFKYMIEEKDDVFSPFWRDVLYTSGSRYAAFSTALQAVWLALLAGCLLTGLRLEGEGDGQRRLLALLCLFVIGLTVFEWIFEAKARYLYVGAPVYVLLGVNGYWRLLSHIGVCLSRARGGKIPESA